MYRYSVDNAVTYTPDDFVLFRESPFALWMERLTLENPEHGIPSDLDSSEPLPDARPQDDIVDTLRDEGRNVVLIPWEEDESRRRADTLDAMRGGADFIVNGVLALGPLCGTANMLMRTSGYSDLGDFLYVPCDTQGEESHHSAFRLCFLADLLHSLQGQLPPQMLQIRGDADVRSLSTEDHIYYYRAVKKRFMDAMREFRKHRMPDPAESSHFGRWSDCACEVLRQRAHSVESRREEELADALRDIAVAEVVEEAVTPAVQVVSTNQSAVASAVGNAQVPLQVNASIAAGAPTLAEQARQLTPNAFDTSSAPGRTPNLAHFPLRPAAREQDASEPEAEKTEKEVAQSGRDNALQNLAFIGSTQPHSLYDSERTVVAVEAGALVAERDVDLDADLDAGIDLPPEAMRELSPDSALQNMPDTAPDPMSDTTSDASLDTISDTPPEAMSDTTLDRVQDFLSKAPPQKALDTAPSPSLRDTTPPEPIIPGYEVEEIDLESLELEPREPLLLPPEDSPSPTMAPRGTAAASPVAAPGASVVDLDSAPPPKPEVAAKEFSDSLITNRDYDGSN